LEEKKRRVITNLLLNVIQGIRRVYGETNEDDMGIRVGEGSETVVVLLSGRIPKRQLDMFAVNLDIGNIVLKDSWDVNLTISLTERTEKLREVPYLRECSLGKHN
jgi:hypothetical protein